MKFFENNDLLHKTTTNVHKNCYNVTALYTVFNRGYEGSN